MSRPDNNISSSHYDVGGLSVLEIWVKKLTVEEFRGLCKGNILKYIARANYKNGEEDYQKAEMYTKWLTASFSDDFPNNIL